ncbi:MAG: hypothetical protein EXR28_09370 [Betaproteobacteria bacterium]|nr:hypothetical protein [Betaproteobacteria bacterium]
MERNRSRASRRIAAIGLLSLSHIALPSSAMAQSPADAGFPAKPVRVILPIPPGGLQDTLARGVTQELSRLWGQSALVEIRPGVGLEPFNLMPDAFAQLIGIERVRNEALVKRLGLQQN